MKLIIYILLILTMNSFAQKPDDLSYILKLETQLSNLKIDTTRLRFENEDLGRRYNKEFVTNMMKIDSLNSANLKMQKELDSLRIFYKQMNTIIDSSVAIFRRDKKTWFINLSYYDWITKRGDKILLKPKKEGKPEQPKFYNYIDFDVSRWSYSYPVRYTYKEIKFKK
jgi:regulator of replication initiation timing